MAKLVNPGLGDIVDRLTILSLKLLYGEQAGKDVTHFRNERNALLTQLRARDSFSWYEHGLGLHAVNAALWQAEDELRELRKWKAPNETLTYYTTAAQCAFRIQALNDERARLISLINANAGEKSGEEKL